jgi:hypothetical protein
MPLRLRYLLVAFVIFLIEVAIAKGIIRGPYIRGSIGDILVIMLIYAFIRGTIGLKPLVAAGVAYGFGVCAELLQYFRLAERLGLEPGGVTYIVLGNTATLSDLIMYAIGGLLALAVDGYLLRGKSTLI